MTKRKRCKSEQPLWTPWAVHRKKWASEAGWYFGNDGYKLPWTDSVAALLSKDTSWEGRNWTSKQGSRPWATNIVEPGSSTSAYSRSFPYYQWKIAIFLSRYQLKGPLSCTLTQITYKDNTVIFHNMMTLIPLLLKSNCSVIMISMFSDTL